MDKKIDLRIQKTYLSLIQAFENLLLEKDFEKISVNELCERAMIRRPTFYKHFLDKYDFLSYFIKDKINQLIQKAQELESKDPQDFFLHLFALLIDEMTNKEQFLGNLKIDSNILSELEAVHDYAQDIIKEQLQLESASDELLLDWSYQAEVLLNLTVHSAHWYLDKQDLISKEQMLEKYRKTLMKLL